MSSSSTRGRGHGRGLARRACRRLRRGVLLVAVVMLVATSASAQSSSTEWRTLDGRGNNQSHPEWGATNVEYRRVGFARYADGIGQPTVGVDPRYVSNRIFNDSNQNLFSQRGVTQWGFAWGQFLDHTFGLRATAGGESQPIPFNADDPLEDFRNDLGTMSFARTPAAPGTGMTNTRQQINTIDSFIDASSVYGNSAARLDWLRQGSLDGDPTNNSALLLLPDDNLPARNARGDAGNAPPVDVDGHLRATPEQALVAGDVRANENLALTGTHLLFAREHNRIVRQLPAGMDEEMKFQIARRVVGATQQYITYTEFLPAIGVQLDPYTGYDPNVNPTLSNEFAVTGYRAHSFVHGELEPVGELADYTPEELEAIEAQGVEVEIDGDEIEFVIPLNVAFFNPGLLNQIGLDAMMHGLGLEAQYANDEQIDNQLRSVLFQVPVSGNPECLDGPGLPECFDGVLDLGAIDLERAHDHGVPDYNSLRRRYGLQAEGQFTHLTGEANDQLPPGMTIDDPRIMEFVELRDRDGNVIDPADEDAVDGDAVEGTRRSTLAARLLAIYRAVDAVDGFVGMLAEQQLPGSELGELQHAIWRDEFERLRDGDRFFYLNDPVLQQINTQFGIDFRHTLSQVITDNTDLDPGDIEADVFFAPPEE